jgi:hypothetical protein
MICLVKVVRLAFRGMLGGEEEMRMLLGFQHGGQR